MFITLEKKLMDLNIGGGAWRLVRLQRHLN
jgi:hypothetical protein